MPPSSLNRRLRGFTLVELVMVIALAGMVAVMISTVLARPLEGFVAQSRRAVLVDQAAGALQRMARDIRLVVPNSVRVNPPGAIGFTGPSVEMLNILDAGRYRPNRVGSSLRFDTPDDLTLCTAKLPTDAEADCAAFQVLDPSFPRSSVDLADAKWMVVYNIGAVSGGVPTAGANVWAGANGESHVIIPAKFTREFIKGVSDYSDETLVSVNLTSSTNKFSFESPQHRFYLADQVVGFRCVGGVSGELQRFTRVELNPSPYNDTYNVLAVGVDCTKTSFNYAPGSAQRSGLLNIVLVLTRDGESVQLLQQVHVDNAP